MPRKNTSQFLIDEEGTSLVKYEMDKRCITQERIAKRTGLSQTLVSRVVSRVAVKIEHIKTVCEYLEIQNWENYVVNVESSLPHQQQVQPPLNIPSNNPCYFPQSSVINFVGREEQLTDLANWLQGDNTSPLVITGMPGTGKSELALQYAWQHRDRYPGGIVWVDAHTENIITRLIQFSIACDHRPPEGIDVLEQLRYCCQSWNAPMLLVLDDLDEYSQVATLLPILPSCVRLLVTTRRYLGSSVQHMTLGALNEEASLALLASVMDVDQPIKRIEAEQEEKAARQLCAFLEYLPLALELVGRYIDLDPDLSIQFLHERLERNALQTSVLNTANPVMRVRRGIAEAFELSWQRLPDDAKRLGCFMALFASSSLSWSLVLEASEAQPLIPVEARPHLLSLHLLRRIETGKYQMHRLLQEFFRIKLDQLGCGEPLKRGLLAILTIHAQHLPEHPNREQIARFQELARHIREAVPTLLPYAADSDFHPLFMGVCHFYQGQAQYQQAFDWSQQYLELAQDRLGSSHPCIIKIYRSLGCLSHFMARFEEAEGFFQNVLALYNLSEHKNPCETAAVHNPLAALYRDWRRFDDAEQQARQALSLREANLTSGHPDIVESLMTLGTVYFAKGRLAPTDEEKEGLLREAENYFVRVLELREHLSQSDHPDIGESWNNLGVLYEVLGELETAKKYHKQAIAFNERVHATVHPITAASYNNLGKVYLQQHQYNEALEYFTIAEEVFEELMLPQSGWCHHNIALVYEAQGKVTEARNNVTLALQILKKTYKLPDNHPFVTGCQNTYERIHQGE
jgi:tetratricopeptide (TPR) repeat protein/transcriptional regulator with XRE-family HTH domain